jgi:DNA-binding winged helix-turn-helix (wHTH) protein
MDAQTGPGSGQSLVIEVGARAAVINGERIELPPAEFDLLHALSLHPGEVVPKEDLLQQVWPDSPVMTSDDLHWRIWSLRKVIGDHRRTDKIIGNRRGVGYFIDLPVEAVEVIPARSAPSTDQDPGTNVVVLEPRAGERELEHTVAEVDPADHDEPDAPRDSQPPVDPTRSALRPGVAAAAVAIVLAMLGGSWLAGYWASQRNVAGAPTSRPSLASSPEAADRPAQDKRAKDVKVTNEKRGGPSKSTGAEPARRKYRARNGGAGSVGQTAAGPVVASGRRGRQRARARSRPHARRRPRRLHHSPTPPCTTSSTPTPGTTT